MSALSADPLSPGTHTIDVQGVALRYHVHGTGPVCVAYPGGPGIFWEYLRMPAVEEHLTVVYPEPVGTGGSGSLPSHPHGYTRDRCTQFLDALIDQLAVPRVALLGHSHGGFVAQHYALRHPERLSGVVLYESSPVTGPEHIAEAVAKVEEFTARHADHPDLPRVLRGWQAVPTVADDQQVTEVIRDLLPGYFADFWGREAEFAPMRESVSGRHISGLDENLVPDPVDDRDTLGDLGVPALVIAGRHDVICGVRWAEELHKLIPGSELLLLEDSGHFGHIEEPERFSRAVVDFVRSAAG
jgi:pimeloyl-ACP methyl ester carboxylesterase